MMTTNMMNGDGNNDVHNNCDVDVVVVDDDVDDEAIVVVVAVVVVVIDE